MAVGFSKTNKPLNPRGNDASPKGYNRAALYSGKALDFDGVNDEINCGDINVAFSEISFAFHFNADSFSDNTIFQKESVFRFIGVNTNQMDIVLATTGNSWYSKKMTLTNLESKDYFLVATYNGSELKAYLNGVLVDTLGGYSGSVVSVSQNVYFGRTNAGAYYNGKISGARIFNTALTAAQVADLYNNPEKIVPTGVADSTLKLYLPMMEGAGTTAYDGSGNGNHGTISGATWTHGIGAPVSQTAVISWNKNVNLLYNTENFASSGWAKLNSLPSSEQTGVTAPDGNGSVTTRFTFSAVNHIIRQYTSSSDTIMSIGVWVYIENKGTGGQELQIDWGDGTGEVFDVSGYDLNTWYLLEAENLTKGSFAFVDISANPSGTAPNGLQARFWGAHMNTGATLGAYIPNNGGTQITSDVLLPQGLTSGRDITGVNLFENVRKQGALNLDGNSWAEVHDNASLDITDAVSLEMWIYWEDQSAEKTILGKWVSGDNRAYALIATTTTGEIDFRQRISSSTYQLGISTLSSGWNHVVATHDHSANERIGYINGVQVSLSSSQGVNNESDNNITIGGHSVAQYTQSIAQPRIYNRALTAAEVLQNYNSGKSIYTNS